MHSKTMQFYLFDEQKKNVFSTVFLHILCLLLLNILCICVFAHKTHQTWLLFFFFLLFSSLFRAHFFTLLFIKLNLYIAFKLWLGCVVVEIMLCVLQPPPNRSTLQLHHIANWTLYIAIAYKHCCSRFLCIGRDMNDFLFRFRFVCFYLKFKCTPFVNDLESFALCSEVLTLWVHIAAYDCWNQQKMEIVWKLKWTNDI